jgi:SulP family sulfate permease
MIALLEARRAGLYARPHWAPNLAASVIVGVVALPLAMVFAIASGARPEQGLHSDHRRRPRIVGQVELHDLQRVSA